MTKMFAGAKVRHSTKISTKSLNASPTAYVSPKPKGNTTAKGQFGRPSGVSRGPRGKSKNRGEVKL